MSGKILIIDTVATNRIVLKVKMTSAQYDVRACGSCQDATDLIASDVPDLIMINLSDPVEDCHQFCRDLRLSAETKGLAIVGVGIADTARARFAALDAGVDDVLPRPMNDALMLARVRSLLRRRNVVAEWEMRDGLGKVLGFDEDRGIRLAPARVSVLSDTGESGVALVAHLQKGLRQAVQLLPTSQGLIAGVATKMPDLMVIDGTTAQVETEDLFRLIADLHSRNGQNHCAVMVVVPAARPELAAMVLDLGADDVAIGDWAEQEISHRARALIAEKQRTDGLREQVRNGLQAAITDPLTGLYNRRYAETNLRTLADQAHAAGCEYALMMLDIDHFKSVNDLHGHAAGDAVLRQLAERLKSSFRSIDVVARIGGEEFLVAMPNTPAIAAQLAAERLRKIVNNRPFDLGPGKAPLRVSISVGIAVDTLQEPEAPTPAIMLDRADKALYAAKSAGRNTVSLNQTAA